MISYSFSALYKMSGKRGSNPRPSAWEADALPTELLPQMRCKGNKSFCITQVDLITFLQSSPVNLRHYNLADGNMRRTLARVKIWADMKVTTYPVTAAAMNRSEEHTSELQSQ